MTTQGVAARLSHRVGFTHLIQRMWVCLHPEYVRGLKCLVCDRMIVGDRFG